MGRWRCVAAAAPPTGASCCCPTEAYSERTFDEGLSGGGGGGITPWGCCSPVPLLPGTLPGGRALSSGEGVAGNVSEEGGPGTAGRGIG